MSTLDIANQVTNNQQRRQAYRERLYKYYEPTITLLEKVYAGSGIAWLRGVMSHRVRNGRIALHSLAVARTIAAKEQIEREVSAFEEQQRRWRAKEAAALALPVERMYRA